MSERRHILIVDDDPAVAEDFDARLREEGFETTVVRTGREALRRVDAAWPDLVLMELVLPGVAGELVALGIKRRADLPIVVLSSIDDPATRAETIERFADDYVTKPADPAELVARIRRVLHRSGGRLVDRPLELGPDLALQLRQRRAIVRGRPVGLSPVEARFLAALAASPGRAVATDQLLARVWSDAGGADPASVWVTVRRLRRKLELDPSRPRLLLTGPSGGYLLAVAE